MAYEIIRDCPYGKAGQVYTDEQYVKVPYERRHYFRRKQEEYYHTHPKPEDSYLMASKSWDWDSRKMETDFTPQTEERPMDFVGGSFGGSGTGGDYDSPSDSSSSNRSDSSSDSSSSDSGSCDSGGSD